MGPTEVSSLFLHGLCLVGLPSHPACPTPISHGPCFLGPLSGKPLPWPALLPRVGLSLGPMSPFPGGLKVWVKTVGV